jgi:hypothetical protein
VAPARQDAAEPRRGSASNVRRSNELPLTS